MTDSSAATNSTAGQGPAGRGPVPALADLGIVRRLLRFGADTGRQHWNAIAVAFFATVMVACGGSALAVPQLDFDLIAYIAVVLEDPALTNEQLHTAAYGAMQAHADEREWHVLRNAYLYNAQMWSNADWFVSQLGMYRVKVGYAALLGALGNITDLVTAAKVLNAICTAVIAVTAYIYMRRNAAVGALPLVLCFMLLTNMFSMAITTSADLVAVAPTLIGILLFASGRFWLAGVAIVLATLVRTDNVILLFAFVLASLVYGQGRIASLLSFAVGLTMVLKSTAGLGHPGWWPHFYFSLIEQQVDMSNFHPPFDPLLYLYTLVEQVGASLHFGAWLGFTLLMAMGWGLAAVRGVSIPRAAQMGLLAAFLCIIGKFIVFPLPADRIYFAQNVAIMMILLAAAKPTLGFAAPAPTNAQATATAAAATASSATPQ